MKIMQKLKTLALSACVAIAVALGSSIATAQTNAGFTYIPLPFTALQTTNTARTYNLADGWSSYATNTSISTFWSNSIAALVTVTNVTYSTNTLYADFSAVGQTIVPIQNTFNWSSGLSNSIWFVSRSVNGVNYPTNISDSAVTSITNSGNGVTTKTGIGTVDMTSYNYGRVLFLKLDSVNAGDWFTNSSLIKGDKRQLSRP